MAAIISESLVLAFVSLLNISKVLVLSLKLEVQLCKRSRPALTQSSCSINISSQMKGVMGVKAVKQRHLGMTCSGTPRREAEEAQVPMGDQKPPPQVGCLVVLCP